MSSMQKLLNKIVKLFLLTATFFSGCSSLSDIKLSMDKEYISERVIGNGKINIVLVHGIAANKETWGTVAEELSRDGRFKIYLVDLLGHGSFSSGIAELTPEVQAKFLSDYLEKRRIEKPVIVGHSYGGIVSLLMQIQHPKPIRKLILVNAPIYESGLPLFVQYFRNSLFSGIVDFLTSSRTRIQISLKQLYYNDKKITSKTIALYEKLLSNPRTKAGIQNASRNINQEKLVGYTDLFSTVDGEIVFIRSKQDTVTKRSILGAVRNSLPNVSIIELNNCGHNAHEECPTALSTIIALESGTK